MQATIISFDLIKDFYAKDVDFREIWYNLSIHELANEFHIY